VQVKIILKEDVAALGKTGDMLVVSDGYARNYLLPRGLAVEASSRNVKMLEHQKKVIQARVKKQKGKALELAEQLTGVSCTIARKAGEEEKLFGSVTSRDIEEALRSKGFAVDRKQILLEEPIKRLGEYSVPVKIHSEVTAEVKVQVVKE